MKFAGSVKSQPRRAAQLGTVLHGHALLYIWSVPRLIVLYCRGRARSQTDHQERNRGLKIVLSFRNTRRPFRLRARLCGERVQFGEENSAQRSPQSGIQAPSLTLEANLPLDYAARQPELLKEEPVSTP
jgi:hypothetical protein